MAIQSGTHLGPYEIISAIGAGGMGEVYRARDPKLGRDVAIKVLPEAFARDTDRMARFQREAKVLASLSHPNIATIYGLEDSGSTRALVMELVEGPTLADRIKAGPIPVDEAVRIAKQIADALEYAHERGIIHRDLKPANVKVTNDDVVKVLDFGLAKALEGDPSSIEISTSPTISRMATQQGVLLGTAAYMSPEQAKAKSVDRRADIWAFGCVLYEMLAGKQAFTGETVTDTLASVIKEEPNWALLPVSTPIRVRVLLQRCLQKDPKQRLQAIGDARISLEEVLSGVAEPPSAVQEKQATLTEPMLFELLLRGLTIGPFALSPDGRYVAIASRGPDAILRLWIRPLNSLEARPLHGSESSVLVGPFFWSPDSRSIAFNADGKLKKIDVSGGPARTLCDVPGTVVGGSWSRDGVIIFGLSQGSLMRISENGGSASPLTSLDPSNKELFHVQPTFLPDGRHFIYLRGTDNPENSGIYVGSLDAKPDEQDSKQLLSTRIGASYVPSSGAGLGHLLFLRERTLMAQLFDTSRLKLVGESVPIAQGIGFVLTSGHFAASDNGVLIYSAGGELSQIAWFDQRGRQLGTVGEPSLYLTVTLSPDGTRAAVCRSDSQNPSLGLWLIDLSRGASTRFTFGSSLATVGIWSPDGTRIIFGSGPGARYDLYQKAASGVRDEELLLESDEPKLPTSWSRDGRFLLYCKRDPVLRKSELWILPLEGDKKPIPFVCTQFNNNDGQFSADGRWVAYTSDESGRNEVYIRTFSPDSGGTASDGEGRWQISIGGGSEPRWPGDGKVLYYLGPDRKLMAVDIATSPVFRAGVPKALFQTPAWGSTSFRQSWDVAPDGKRFFFVTLTAAATPFTVVLNWSSLLKK